MPLHEQSDEDKEYVCDGLEWALDKVIDVRDFTLSIPGIENEERHLTALLYNSNKRAMAMHIIQRCTTSFHFDFEACADYASESRDMEMLRALCENPSVDVNESAGIALYNCAYKNSLEEAEILLDVGKANPNIIEFGRPTALHIATQEGHLDMCRLLFSWGADVNMLNAILDEEGQFEDEYESALDMATTEGHAEIAAFLKSKGGLTSEEEIERREEEHPLRFAAERGDLDEVNLLCKEKVDGVVKDMEITFPDMDGGRVTPLLTALYEDNAEVAGVLISHGANSEACDAQNSTPLHVAAFRGFTDLARTLVKDCKVDVDAVNANFVTPLWCAVHGGHEKTVRVLIEEFGARLDVPSRSGRTILHEAALDNQVAIAKMLFEEYGPAVDAQDEGGMTPRDLARRCHGEDSEIYQLLLSHSVQA